MVRRPSGDFSGWQEKIRKDNQEWQTPIAERAAVEANPINPQRVFAELSPLLPGRGILTSDSGSAANWFARNLQLRRGMMASLSGGLASMGPGVPYAIGAKLLSDEYDAAQERLVGNFPQSFSHVALINSARNLSAELRPAEHRKNT